MIFLHILFLVYQENAAQPGGDGHWFTIALNMDDKQFQVIDSLRNSYNDDLKLKTSHVRAKSDHLMEQIHIKAQGMQGSSHLQVHAAVHQWVQAIRDVSTSRSILF